MTSIKILCIALLVTITASGQKTEGDKSQNNMETKKLTNTTVKMAFDALQEGDKTKWKTLFADKVTFTDDGNPRDFDKFSEDAIGSERFTSIDKVENEGKDIYGDFHSDQWGDFKVFFKFGLDSEGKINRLDIGQLN